MTTGRAWVKALASTLRRRARFLLYRVHAAWVLRDQRCAEAQASGDSHVLLVRADLIGDFLLWAAAGQALAAHYRRMGWRITLVVNQDCAALAEAFEIGDEVWPLDRSRFVGDLGYRAAFLRRIAQRGFAEALQVAYSREAFIDDGLIEASAAARRLSCSDECYNIAAADRARSDATYTGHIPSRAGPCMELERNAALTRALGQTDFRAAVARLPENSGLFPDELQGLRYVVLIPGASGAAKRWPAARFAEIGRRLSEHRSIVIAGGPDDVALGREVAAEIGRPVIDLSGKTTLLQLAEVLRRASLVLGNDSAAAHLGAVVGAPVVCIVGGWQPHRFMPYEVEVRDERPLPVAVGYPMACWGCNRNCIHPVHRDRALYCVDQVSLDAVWAAVSALPV